MDLQKLWNSIASGMLVKVIATIATSVVLTFLVFVLRPHTVMVQGEIVARVINAQVTDFDAWDGLHKYNAPQVPAPAEHHILSEDVVKCPRGYEPAMAWHEITGSWPSTDVMYTVNANVTKNKEIEIALRSRQSNAYHNFQRGYAYIDVIVQCRARGALFRVGNTIANIIDPKD